MPPVQLPLRYQLSHRLLVLGRSSSGHPCRQTHILMAWHHKATDVAGDVAVAVAAEKGKGASLVVVKARAVAATMPSTLPPSPDMSDI